MVFPKTAGAGAALIPPPKLNPVLAVLPNAASGAAALRLPKAGAEADVVPPIPKLNPVLALAERAAGRAALMPPTDVGAGAVATAGPA